MNPRMNMNSQRSASRWRLSGLVRAQRKVLKASGTLGARDVVSGRRAAGADLAPVAVTGSCSPQVPVINTPVSAPVALDAVPVRDPAPLLAGPPVTEGDAKPLPSRPHERRGTVRKRNPARTAGKKLDADSAGNKKTRLDRRRKRRARSKKQTKDESDQPHKTKHTRKR